MTVPEPGRIALVVEDETLVRTRMGDTVVELGFRVQMARDGAEALDALERSSVHLALVDRDAPSLDCLTLCRVPRARPTTRDILIVLMSGFLGEGALTPPIVNAFLAKSFSVEVLRATVEQVLRRS